jgi:phosphonate transport system substrate-binding protein
MNRRAMLSGAAALALAACSKSADNTAASGPPKVLNFSVLATENSTSLQEVWNPILKDMEKAIGIPVKGFYASNYNALIEAMRFKQVDAGWFSNLSGLEAVRRAGGEVFARTFDPSGVDGYRSVIIVPAKSKTTAEDLLKCDKKLSFGIGDVKSTSGTLAPKTYFFSPHNIDPNNCFKTLRSANHQANLFAVANGVLDAATGNSTSLAIETKRNPDLVNKVRVVWQSPALPEDPMVWRKDLDPAVKAKIKAFFLGYGQGDGPEAERQRKLIATFSIGGFKSDDDTHLIPVEEMEATETLDEAKRSGDAGKIAAAQKALDAIHARAAAAGKPTAKAAIG